MFTSVCAGIAFVPLVTTPVMPAGWTAVQVKVLLGVVLLRFTTVLAAPEQITWSVG